MGMEEDLAILFKAARQDGPEEFRAEIQRFTERHGQTGVARVALLTLPHLKCPPGSRRIVGEELKRLGIDPAETEQW